MVIEEVFLKWKKKTQIPIRKNKTKTTCTDRVCQRGRRLTERAPNAQSWDNLSNKIKKYWIITQNIKYVSMNLY